MRREHGGLADGRERTSIRHARRTQHPQPFEQRKSGMTFIQMEHAAAYPQSRERADAAHAEHDFLLHARLAIAAIEALRNRAVPPGILGMIGVE